MRLRNSWLGAICLSATSLVISSSVVSEPVKENIGLYGGNVMDIATMDNSGTTEVLIAVDNSQRGIYQYQATSGSMPDHWFSTTNPPTGTSTAAVNAIPGFASQVEADASISGHVYATVSNQRTGDNGVLYFNDNFGSVSSVSPMTVGWTVVQELASSNAMSDIRTLKSGPTSVFAASQRDIYEISNGAALGLTFSLDSMSGYADYEIVDFAIATATLAYATIRNEFAYELISIDLTTGTSSTSATASSLTLPSFAPVVQRTGACPIDSTYCAVAAELVAADPADTTGNTIYVAGSSVNAMVFKSTDGGNTWDDGYDYQCSSDTSRTTSTCTAYGFTDGYPRGDVVRFRGTSSTSPTESRHVFIGRVVFDNDNAADGWQMVPRLTSLIRPSGSSGPAIYQDTNANDPALETDPNDSTKFYIATDLAIGTFTHDPSTGFPTPAAGSELANARGIEGLIVNDLDYFENAPDDKHLWIVTKSGAAFAKNYDPSDPTSVSTAGDWVYPIYAGGDGAPHRAVVIDPNDKSNVIIGSTNAYLNETGDAIDPSTGSVDYSLVANPINWTRVFEPQNFATDPSVDASTTDPLFSSNVERSYVTALEWQTAGSCDRVYMSVANTDEGDVGGIFYSDDDGATWTADTLNGGSPRLSMPVNDLLVNDNFIWAGVGDRDGRSSEAGVRARVSYCGTSAWWKPTSSDATFTDIQANDYVAALDGVSTPSDATYDAVLYMASSNETTTRLTKASKERTSVSGCSSFACWQFSDVTPPNTYGSLNAVAVEPHDADHVWAAYSNCIVESTDGGATWAEFGGSCTDDHEEIRTLVYDDLIAGTSSGAFAYAEEADFAVMDGVFGGFVADGDTFTFPTGSESWAGVANTNTDLYPLSFPEGGEVLFRAAIPEGGVDTTINFKFEANPHPNNTPAFSTENVVISGGLAEYSVAIPPQDANQTYNSFLMYIVENDQSVVVQDIEVEMSGDEPPEVDTDNDGVPDDEDAFPNDPAASVDADNDGMPDAWNPNATQEQIDASELTLDADPTTPGDGNGGGGEPMGPPMADFSEAFGGTTIGEGGTYTFPTGAEDWAGFANMNTELYPIDFPEGGRISFMGSVADGGTADVRFRFEKNPHPDTEPSFNTEVVTVSGADPKLYEITIEPQGENTFSSFIMYIDTRDVTVTVTDVVVDYGTPPEFAVMDGVFGGFVADGDTFTFPTGSESWAGVANTNTDLYPLSFPEGGEVRFRASIPEGGVDTTINFKFEANPHPNNTPAFSTENVVISGGLADYSVAIPPQDANQTYNSFLMYIVENDQSVMVKDIEVVMSGEGPSEPADADNDGVPDDEDAFPNDPAASVDADNDGMPDAWNPNATQEQIDASELTLDADPTTPGDGNGGGGEPMGPPMADFSEAFGGTTIGEGGTYTFPTGAEDWAGFANMNTELYPIDFPEGGRISFMGSVADGGTADVRFRFEKNPHPDTEPSFNTEVVTVSGADPKLYEITIEPQGENTFSSFIMYIDTRDVTVTVTDVVVDYGTPPEFAVMDGVFGGFVADGDTFTFPTGSESWAGVANTNTDLYPLSFPEGGEVRFRASIPEGGVDTTINFKFEANPHPNNTPAFSTENVVISGGLADYSVAIPPQDANQTYNSFLMYIVENDQSVMVKDIEVVMSGEGPSEPADADNDGVPDDEDAFPNDPAASVDADNDGMPDAWNPNATQEQIDASELTLDADPTTPGDGNGGGGEPMGPPMADFSEAFGGTTIGEGGTYTFPTGAEDWAGFANMNTELYPIDFPEGGRISFMGSVADGGTADVRFRFEKNPHPDTEPSFNTEVVTVSGADPKLYEITIEPQGENTFSSFIMYIDTRDVTVTVTDVVVDYGTPPEFAVMDGVFGGFVADGDTFTFPTGSESWAGVANTNTDLYPLSFPEGGEVRFRASIPEGGVDTTINFKFEANPHPNNTPAFSTENVVISGGLADYSVAIPPQDANQTYNSFLMYIVENDQSVMVKDIEVVMYGDGPSEPEEPSGPQYAEFSEGFGGAVPGEGDTYSVPESAESWAGFANMNTALYPLVFEFGGRITFVGSVADGGAADIRFRFERKPHPDTEPSFNTEVVAIDGSDPMMYEVAIPPQGTNSFESLIMYLDTRDVTVTITDVRVQPAPDPRFAVMDGVFGGFVAEGDTFEFPTGSEPWAGVANTNTALYPMSFPEGGEVRFKAGTPPESGSTQVYFKFEANPHPNNNPSFDTLTALVAGELSDYTLEIPAQDPNQTFNSFLMYIVENDQPVMVENIEVVSFGPPDADGDGVADDEDAFPNDPAASVDTDGDGMPDDWNEGADDILISESPLTLDEDDDNDGYTDEEESAEGTDPANADSTPFVPRSRIPFLVPIFNS